MKLGDDKNRMTYEERKDALLKNSKLKVMSDEEWNDMVKGVGYRRLPGCLGRVPGPILRLFGIKK